MKAKSYIDHLKFRVKYFLAFVSLSMTLFVNCHSQSFPVSIDVEVNNKIGPMTTAWAYFGYDEPNYTYMPDGKKLLTELSELSPVPVFIRTHNLLTTGDGTPALKWGSTNAYTEDKDGNPVYDWTILDSIFDTYFERGMKPLVQIGFMPEALSTNPEPYRHEWSEDDEYNKIYTGWTYPPNDYGKWEELVYQWVKHCINRYGEEEVNTWYWQLWNEPNIGYWSGTVEEYCKLYDYTMHAVKRACPGTTVGGPHTTGPRWDYAADYLITFLNHCLEGKNYRTGETGSPLEYISFHAKGGPRVVEGHVRMDMGAQLADIARGFEIVASYPKFRHLPVVIGECDPEGCAACSEKKYPRNAYRNGTMYSVYTAASFARIYELADKFDINLEGILSWSFVFEDQPWFNGYRDLATNGVNKPVLNVFRIFGMMSGDRLKTSGNHFITATDIIEKGVTSKPDVNAMACIDDKVITIMVWHYHDDDLPGDVAEVTLNLNGISGKQALMHHYRIDDIFSNSYEVWKAMGHPQDVSPEQYEILERAGHLKLFESPVYVRGTKVDELQIDFRLPRQGVSLIKLDFNPILTDAHKN